VKSAIREEFRSLSTEELLNKGHELGVAYETNAFGCSQSTIAALYRILDFPDVLVKAATSAAGGTVSQLVGTCGALIGGIMVLDYFFGRPFEHMSDKERIDDPNTIEMLAAMAISRQLCDKYFEQYGTITCVNIQRQLYDRIFWLEDMQEIEKMEEAGGHSNPKKCPGIAGNAVRWTLEIILNTDK